MAATVTAPVLVGVGVSKPEDESFPWTLTTRWYATKLSNGTPAPVVITTDLASADELDQTAWDGVFSAVLAAYTSIYSNSPTISPSNPIDI